MPKYCEDNLIPVKSKVAGAGTTNEDTDTAFKAFTATVVESLRQRFVIKQID